MEESHHQLREIRRAHSEPERGLWQEIQNAISNEHTASTLPVTLRKQCDEILDRRTVWLGDFNTELAAILARGQEVRERLLFEDVDRAGWFSAAGISALEVQRLLERHAEMHQRAARFSRQLKLLSRGLQQQGALSSRRRAFQAKTVGEKLQSSLVCLAAVAVAPVPGSSEMWLATTTMMWLDKDQAWQHVVYEHPRDVDTDTILDQFQCRSSKALLSLQ
ncbi:EXD3 [Symbiodinium microadriaticum]|nr:EXD3 [Symbiodinium microadriaticum]CAE7908008.1 EXD3 [Symbiodinium sp. KB8]